MQKAIPRKSELKIVWRIFAAFFLVYFTTSSGGFESGDAITRYETAKSFIRGGMGALPEGMALNSTARGRDGRMFSSYGLSQSLLLVPYLVVSRFLPISPEGKDALIRIVFNLILIPGLSALAFVILFGALLELGYHARPALFSVFVLGLSTPLWHYSRSAQEEHLLALAFAVWLLGIAKTQNGKGGGIFIASVAGCAALFTRWAAVAPLFPMAAATVYLGFFDFKKWKKELVGGFALATFTLLVLLTYNKYRFGSAFETGYGLALARDGIPLFSASQASGVFFALIASPYRGLLVYAPSMFIVGYFLASEKKIPFVERAGIASFIAMFALNTFYGFWTGGSSWGPRFLIAPLILFAPTLARFYSKNSSAIWWKPLVALSVLVQVFSVTLPSGTEDLIRQKQGINSFQAKNAWQCEFSAPCIRPVWTWSAIRNTLSGNSGVIAPRGGVNSADETLASSDFQALFWWPIRFSLRFHIFSRFIGIASALALLSASLWLFDRVWRMAAR